MSGDPSRQSGDGDALAAARVAAHEAWLVSEISTHQVLERAVAACVAHVGGHRVRRILPDLEDATGVEPPAVGWQGLDAGQRDESAWDWVWQVVPLGDECPRLWRRLGIRLRAAVITARDDRGDEMVWSRLTHGGEDRHFYYWSGGAQDSIYHLFEPTRATRSTRANALLELVSQSIEEIAPTELTVSADSATFARVERFALARHGLAVRRA